MSEKIAGNEIRPGNIINYQNTLWRAIKCNAVKPGKGGAYNQVELKNLFDGRKLNERFRSAENVERVRLEQRNFTYLYPSGEMLVFMDDESFDQVELHSEFLSETEQAFLEEGMKIILERHEDRYIGCELPAQVTRTIVETEPAIKGQTASSSFKPAILDNGLRVLVPTFLTTDERIIVSTADVEYVKRAD